MNPEFADALERLRKLEARRYLDALDGIWNKIDDIHGLCDDEDPRFDGVRALLEQLTGVLESMESKGKETHDMKKISSTRGVEAVINSMNYGIEVTFWDASDGSGPRRDRRIREALDYPCCRLLEACVVSGFGEYYASGDGEDEVEMVSLQFCPNTEAADRGSEPLFSEAAEEFFRSLGKDDFGEPIGKVVTVEDTR
jgi:hypothetical protein